MSLSLSSMRDFIFNEDPYDTSKVGSFYTTGSILVAYLLFVKVFGPHYMRNRKPFQLREVLIVYNAVVVAMNVYLTYKMGKFGYGKLNLLCRDQSTYDWDAYLRYLFKLAWLFYLSKYVDLLDTVFFVLRKKTRQITFLHISHHILMVFLGYWGFLYQVHSQFIALMMPINTFVHVIMYSYYGLAAFGPHMQKYLWWKKYMTSLQLIQFVIMLIFMAFGLAFGCLKFDFIVAAVFCFIAMMFYLFSDFYVKSYF